MVAWGLPISLIPALLTNVLPCSTANVIALGLLFCAAGVIQWYYILRGVESLLRELYRWLRSMGRDTVG